MEGLISLLLFAAFFYLMMRFGCEAHMVHGHGGGREAGARHKDPVCGMDVDPKQGYGNSSAWRVLYMSQQLGDLATTGAYARVRHP